MPSAHGAHIKYMFQNQPDAVLNQPNPVSATLYPILAATEDVEAYSITASATWTVQPSPIEIIVTIDGVTKTFYFNNPVTLQAYEISFYAGAADSLLVAHTQIRGSDRGVTFKGHSIQVEARVTGGTVQNLGGRVKYARLLPT